MKICPLSLSHYLELKRLNLLQATPASSSSFDLWIKKKKKKTQDAIEAKLQTQGCLSYFRACISIYTYISNAFSQMKKHCPDGEFTKYLQ